MEIKARTLSDIHGEESLDITADIMTPIVELGTDDELRTMFSEKGNNIAEILKRAVSKHNQALYELLSTLAVDAESGSRITVEEYKKNCSPILIMNQLSMVINDPAIQSLFFSPAEKKPNTDSGSATENTEESGN